MMRDLLSCVGLVARRQTLFLTNMRTGEKVFLWGVVEVLEPDMQDYTHVSLRLTVFGAETDNSPFSVGWSVDNIELTESFLKQPQIGYIIDGAKIRFMGKSMVQDPNANSSLLLLMDELEQNNLHVVLPKRDCTGYLNVWLDKDRDTETFVMENKTLQEAISELTLNEIGYDLSLYPHHLGNLYLLTYHPVFRSIDLTCSTDPMGLFVRFNLRKRSEGDFTIRVEDYHHKDLCIGEKEFKVNVNDRFVLLPLPSEPNNLSITIFDDKGCLVYKRSGIRFIKGISVNVSIGDEKIPSPKRNVRVENYFGSQIKRSEKPKTQESDLIVLGGRSKDQEEAMNEAHKWIGDVLRSAEEKCYIIDPFFRADDFIAFVSPVTDIKANINILISDAALDKEGADRLLRAIRDYNENANGEEIVRCRVSRGSRKLHTKMVATDKEAWMMSTSFMEFGKSALSIVKMPDEQTKASKRRVEQMWLDGNNTIKLEDYVGS